MRVVAPEPQAILVLPSTDAAARQDLELEVLAAYLRQAGLPTVFCQFPGTVADGGWIECLRGSSARLIYWHLPSRAEYRAVLQESERLSRLPRQSLWVAGGDFAARHDVAILTATDLFAAVVRGEPELTVEALAAALGKGGAWWCEPGITHRRSGLPTRNVARPLLQDLDRLPPAADDLCGPERRRTGQQILLGRGCNSDCQYCGLQTPYREEYPRQTAFWRSRSAGAIVDEIEWFAARHGIDSFLFNSHVVFGYDTASSAILQAVAEEILRRGLRIQFSFVTHAEALHRNLHLLPLLLRSGLRQLTLGIDSGLPRVFEMYEVHCSRTVIREALEALHRLRVTFRPAFIFYDPYLTLPEIRENLAFLRELSPFFSHMPLPYSYFLDQYLVSTVLRVRCEAPIYRRLQADGLASVADPLSEDPRISFQDPTAGRFFRIHQLTNARLLRKLRSLYCDPEVVRRFPHLELFPLDLLERIGELSKEPELTEEQAQDRISAWAWDRIEAGAQDMLDLLSLDSGQRKQFQQFFQELSGAASETVGAERLSTKG